MANPYGNHIHGERGPVRSPTYVTWINMRARVRNQEGCYKGVDMDPRWFKFEAFLLDVGDRPPGYELGRIDPTKGYWPNNVQWQPRHENRRQTRRWAK